MAANYWESTQRLHWLFEKNELAYIRKKLDDDEQALIQQYPLPERRLLSIYFNQQITKLGRRLNIRQQALATAQIYLRRFYLKVEIRWTNPYLLMATAVYLACKMEECPQHIRTVVSDARSLWADFIVADTSKLGECEFLLISEMNSQLIVHHPYRTLMDLQSTFSLTSEDISLAWSVINDHYLTDLPLLYPPHIIAVTAILLAVVVKQTQGGIRETASTAAAFSSALHSSLGLSPVSGNYPSSIARSSSSSQTKVQKLVNWLAESEIDIEGVIDATQHIMSLYEVWEQSYNDKECKEQIARFVKARGLDK
ncbi:MAG: RNA polymerase II holoenzyme cyclin-like subunit [Trizodia sp. TS-e1964]|nr:MAG: RNA polymerase II holoenzyme cyclin-like subunit [Trizodia sp. TS-e1964]